MIVQGTFAWHTDASKERKNVAAATAATVVSRIAILKESITDTMLQERS